LAIRKKPKLINQMRSVQMFYQSKKFILLCFALISSILFTACQAYATSTPNLASTTAPLDEPAATLTARATLFSAVPTPLPNTGSATTDSFATAIRNVSQKVRPSVVQITNEQVQIDLFNGAYTVPAGVGSGVIYDSQGHILTNDHVVTGAQKLLVSLPDGRTFKAKLVGEDPTTDLAVLQINGKNLPVAQLGDSRQLQIGDWVVAIGNALALTGGPTVSAGVVSALGRTIQEPGGTFAQSGPYLFDLIQTDAPINPGNSGGALVNLNGQVIGINTLIAGQAEPGVQAQGIGFAIAINTAKPIADALVANGKVIHPYLGFQYIPLNPSMSFQLGIQQTQGAVISGIDPGSPAGQAGLQIQDVITAIDHTPLIGDSALAQIINEHKPGDVLTLSVLRGNQKLSVKLKLGETTS
jgi:S1-C subfamily serine protease